MSCSLTFLRTLGSAQANLHQVRSSRQSKQSPVFRSLSIGTPSTVKATTGSTCDLSTKCARSSTYIVTRVPPGYAASQRPLMSSVHYTIVSWKDCSRSSLLLLLLLTLASLPTSCASTSIATVVGSPVHLPLCRGCTSPHDGHPEQVARRTSQPFNQQPMEPSPHSDHQQSWTPSVECRLRQPQLRSLGCPR
ncbi:hypothetical protein BJ546DRAFT_6844 [Cryomyces antarcticus]